MDATAPTDDHAAQLRARYRAERDKRVRPDGNDQYLEVTGRFAQYADDPYVSPSPRDPLTDEVTVAVIGGGFAGLIMAARLKQAGIADVRLIDKGGDVGGTWYWNRYPGAQCDTSAMIYLPLLEETGHMPTEKYVHAPEILEHCRRIATQFGLYENACLSTEVTHLEWDGTASRWIIRTNRGDAMRAKYVTIGAGPLHRPKLPGIPGIETFDGHSFHTSRWDYDYTGGDANGGALDRLGDKRVGVIGTGATAVQCVPHLARACKELFVFQRTPSSIDVRNNAPIDPSWYATLEPGWQHEWLLNFATVQTGGSAAVDHVMDGWTDIAHRIRERLLADPEPDFSPKGLRRAYELSDDDKMDEIRRRVDTIVADTATADALKPWYRQLCKRPCFHDAYLQAYNEPGTHLVDTDGRGVERIDATGVIVDGRHYELDCIIYASGFEVGTAFTRRAGFDATGREGVMLSEHWAKGMRSMHGIHTAGFPNLFVTGHAQGGALLSNVPHNLTVAAATVRAVIAHAESIGAATVEVTPDAEQAWLDELATARPRFTLDETCTPGYYNNEGQPIADRLSWAGYPAGPVAFFEFIEAWAASGEFAGLSFGLAP